ncbi:MAG: Alkanesulfonates transport system permease protein, partial [uncultured Chloroflexia bacterium]
EANRAAAASGRSRSCSWNISAGTGTANAACSGSSGRPVADCYTGRRFRSQPASRAARRGVGRLGAGCDQPDLGTPRGQSPPRLLGLRARQSCRNRARTVGRSVADRGRAPGADHPGDTCDSIARLGAAAGAVDGRGRG